MSNNKQSSVEWLRSLYERRPAYEQFITDEEWEQAKEMHREEVRVAYLEGAFKKMRHLYGKEFMMPTDYYNQTFGK